MRAGATDGMQMSDSLRDRIAAVIAQHAVCMCGEWAENMTEQAQHQADAVIAELGLQPIQRTTMFPERRWVTPWELIDEQQEDLA